MFERVMWLFSLVHKLSDNVLWGPHLLDIVFIMYLAYTCSSHENLIVKFLVSWQFLIWF